MRTEFRDGAVGLKGIGLAEEGEEVPRIPGCVRELPVMAGIAALSE